MNTTTNWAGIIGSFVRFALGGVAGSGGLLVMKGIITPDQGEFILVSAAAAAATIGGALWIWFKTKAEEKLKNTQIELALKANSSTWVETIKADAALANKF